MPRLVVSLLLFIFWQCVGAAFPSPELLAELDRRLQQPPACQPGCAAIQHLEINAGSDLIHMSLDVHAENLVAIPLPVREGQWWPSHYLIDDDAAPVLMRDSQGTLWILVSKGQHRVELKGKVNARSQLDLPLPLPPAKVKIVTSDWAVNGLDENGVPQRQLQLIRKQKADAGQGKALEPGILPALLKVTRTIHLGMEWNVNTRILRLSPPGSPVTLKLPLIRGEAVTSAGFDVEEGHLLLRMPAGQSQVTFHSKLKPTEELILTAPTAVPWSEEWQLDVGPIWHVNHQGLPVIHHQDGSGAWLPSWSPLPGEQVRVLVSRPQGVEGNSLTIDRSRLEVTPGQRATDSSLLLELRSSQGGQHTISLPQGSILRQVKIDGRTQPVRQDDLRVTLPVRPGQQLVELDWRTEQGIDTFFHSPALDLGIKSVNHAIGVNLGKERWTLLVSGPLMGPAVLFWSVLIIITLMALVLGRIGLSPLKWYHWFLLGIGLSQASLFGGLIILGWLLSLGMRDRMEHPSKKPGLHNLSQVVLVLLTIMALQALFDAIRSGLLGMPDMQISGNGSSAYLLNWYQDRVGQVPDQAFILSVPLMVYRMAMLAWALWLAFALLGWLKWSWQVFSRYGVWQQTDFSARWKMKSGNKAQEDTDDPWLSEKQVKNEKDE